MDGRIKYIKSAIVSVLLIVVLIIAGCGINTTSAGGSATKETQTQSTEFKQPATEVQQTQALIQETVSNPATEAQQTQTSIQETVSNPATEAQVQVYSADGKYTVFDPNNTRGLASAGQGYGYGYASGGKPHQISVDNQKRFDKMSQVKALALDVKSSGKVLYLTFDCGYEYNDNTDRILNVLKEKQVKAAFFCTRPFIDEHGSTVKRMIDEGHIVGNHSTNHPVFPKITRIKMAEELWGVSSVLKSKYNYDCEYFRFPTGEYSHNSLELVTSQGYKSVFWSIAHVDWYTNNQPKESEAISTLTGRLHPGAVILLHTVSNTNVAILDDFIDAAQAQGYTFVTLDDYKWN